MWRFGFFDAVETAPGVYDRVYNAEEFSVPFSALIDTGVLEGAGDSLEVTTDGSSMQTTIGTGVAFIRGRYAENTSPRAHTHDTETVGVDRIDRIVIRLDLRPEARHVESFVKKGVASANPVPPALQRDDNVYEISLAQVRIRGGQTFISPSDITDERGDENICPWARSKVLPHIDAQDVIDLRNDFEAFKDVVTQSETEIVTVGSGGDFSTINEALEYLSQRHARFWQEGYTAEIRLLSGFVMQEQVFVEGVDLGWVTITAQDSQVIIDRASLTNETPSLGNLGFISPIRRPAFFAYKNATLPVIGALFTMNATDQANARDGIVVSHNSKVIINRGCGIRNVGQGSPYGTPTPGGLLVASGSLAVADGGDFSGSAIGIGVYNGSIVSAEEVDLSNCSIMPATVYSSRLCAANANMANSGTTGLEVYNGSYVDIEAADLSGSSGAGLVVSDGCFVNAHLADISEASGSEGVRIINGCVVNLANSNCRKDPQTDRADDILVLGGCIVTIHGAQGGSSLVTNEVTPNGIVFEL